MAQYQVNYHLPFCLRPCAQASALRPE